MNVVVIGCTPMAEKVINTLFSLPEIQITGVVNLSTAKGCYKANYSSMYGLQHRLRNNYQEVDDVNAATTIAWIAERKPEIILQVGWSQIFKPSVLQLAARCCLGLHAAPLPEGRGAAILNWKLLEGGGPWGISLFIMEEKTDTGAVLDFEPFELENRDDIRMAYLKADRAAVAIVKRTFPRLEQRMERLFPQDSRKVTRYYSRKPSDGRLHNQMTTLEILNYVRALTHPYPGAFIDTPYGRLLVWKAEEHKVEKLYKPGAIINILPGEGVVLATTDGAVMLTEITPPDGLAIWCDIWAQDIGLRIGDIFIPHKQGCV